jgi:hypothetical protein
MLMEEAAWIGRKLTEFDVGKLSPMLDLGSSTQVFRTVEQPYVDNMIFAPLVKRGCDVKHVDVKMADGVDVVADIFDEPGYLQLGALRSRSILCASLLEHVPNPGLAIQRIVGLLPSGGILLLTVPYSFPRHADPIDTMFRPSEVELSGMLREQEVRCCEVVTGRTLLGELLTRRSIRSAGEPTLGEGWRLRPQVLYHLFWLCRPYRITCALAIKR